MRIRWTPAAADDLQHNSDSLRERFSARKLLLGSVKQWLIIATVVLFLSLGLLIVGSMRWRVTGDASLMSYVSFLNQKGLVPYREIQDLNLPGSYVPSWFLERFLAQSDLAWRFYDLGLCALIAFGMYVIAKPFSRFAAVWAGCLFALIHGRDGLEQAGERDLCAAALIMAGIASLVWAKRTSRVWPALLFGLSTGAALTVKPTMIFFVSLPLLDQHFTPSLDASALKRTMVALAALAMPLIGCVIWLRNSGSLDAFLYSMRVLGPYHASLGHAPWSTLLNNSLSPLLPAGIGWVVMSLLARKSDRIDAATLPSEVAVRVLLYGAASAGFLSFVIQRRGYPYQRYPFLEFALLVMALDFTRYLRQGGIPKALGALALIWSSFFVAPSSAVKAIRYQEVETPFISQLSNDLLRLAPEQKLSSLQGRVQCLDSVSGCLETLERMQIVQATGILYDEFLFHAPSAEAVRTTREMFTEKVAIEPPLIFVVTEPLFPSGPDHYAKLDGWPEFKTWLMSHYDLAVERSPTQSRRSMGRSIVPSGYRLYLRRGVNGPVP